MTQKFGRLQATKMEKTSMKTAYVARAVIPSQSANSIHVMKISESFAEICEEFELIVPENKQEEIKEDIYDYYGINHKFPVIRVKQAKFLKGMYRYSFALRAMNKILRGECEQIITRDPLVAFLTVLLHKRTVLDLHGEIAHLAGRAYRIIKWDFFRKSKYLKIVMITESLVRFYEKKYKLPSELATVLPDGCTLENFEAYYKNALLQNDTLKLAYAGSFGVGRGYEVIQALAEQDKDNSYYIYGGNKEDALKVISHEPPENIAFQGFIANREIPRALCSQDILLLPYQNTLIAKGEDTGKVMSPLKLFEYMASGRVIIASDLEVLKEILNESNCYFAVPDDPSSWKKAIEEINNNRDEAIQKAHRARKDVEQYTWKIRAQKMIGLIR